MLDGSVVVLVLCVSQNGVTNVRQIEDDARSAFLLTGLEMEHLRVHGGRVRPGPGGDDHDAQV